MSLHLHLLPNDGMPTEEIFSDFEEDANSDFDDEKENSDFENERNSDFEQEGISDSEPFLEPPRSVNFDSDAQTVLQSQV
eukprot:m.94864 g.94864  ORF g.94864 m.94864 type:complete len:80 (-) comp26762_c1_seq1:25-264(-)